MAPRILVMALSLGLALTVSPAKAVRQQANESAPTNRALAVSYFNCGVAREEQGDMKKALQFYDLAIETDKYCLSALINRGQLRTQQFDEINGLKDCEEAVKIAPNDPRALAARGYAHANLGDRKNAFKDFSAVIKIKPSDPWAYHRRSLERDDRTDKDGILADLNMAVKLGTTQSSVFSDRANCLLERGKQRQAMQDFDQAIKLDEEGGLSSRGSALQAIDDKKCLNDFDKVIKIAPSSNAYQYRASALHKFGDLTGAMADYNQAIRLNPKNAGAFSGRGDVLHSLHKDADALKDYNHAVKIDQTKFAGYNSRAWGRYFCKDMSGAIEDFTASLKLRTSPDSYMSRGLMFADMGNNANAINDYTQAIALKPNFADAFYYRAKAKFHGGDYTGAAIDYYQSSICNINTTLLGFSQSCAIKFSLFQN